MELTMSMFATRADYWKARADLAEQTMHETAEALGCKPDNEAMLVAARNAERYRWLRNNPLWSVGYRVKPRSGMREWRMRDEGDYWGPWWPTHEQAVDHAIKAQVAVGAA